jgi:hypothetical protein
MRWLWEENKNKVIDLIKKHLKGLSYKEIQKQIYT